MGLLLLVRHGQASFGADDYDVLSATGHEQSRLLGGHLARHGVVPDVVVRGDMRRHRETADGMVAGAGWDLPVEVDAGWDEFDHLGVVAAHPALASPDRGSSDLDRRQFQRVFEEATALWTSGADDAAYPETWAGFLGRVRGSLRRACAQAGPGGTVVVVTSGGPVAAVAATLVAPPLEGGADDDPALTARAWGRFNTVVVNTSCSRVVVGSTGPRLLTFNEHPHLTGDLLTYR